MARVRLHMTVEGVSGMGVNMQSPDARPHTPQRPLWLCCSCALPWPCGAAKLYLVREYECDRTGLALYLCAQLYDATTDLYRLYPSNPPKPQVLHARFLGWVRT